MSKMSGTYCEMTQYPAKDFDKRSFRWKQSGSSWLLVACPKGNWSPGKTKCKTGTRVHKILTRSKICPGGKQVVK